MSATKKIVIVIIVLVALFVIFYFYKKSQNKPLRFLDNGFSGALLGSQNYGGNLSFVLKEGIKSGLKKGDTVKIVQDAGFKYPQYDGDAKVRLVSMGAGSYSRNEIVVIEPESKGYAGSSPVNPGYLTKVNVF